MQSPTVLLGKPGDADKYDLYSVEDTSVYVKKNIQTRNDELRVYLSKFLWVKDLVVDGMRINY